MKTVNHIINGKFEILLIACDWRPEFRTCQFVSTIFFSNLSATKHFGLAFCLSLQSFWIWCCLSYFASSNVFASSFAWCHQFLLVPVYLISQVAGPQTQLWAVTLAWNKLLVLVISDLTYWYMQISDAVKSSYGGRDDNIVEYVSMQSALYMTCFACGLGGAFFLLTAIFIDADRRHTERITHGELLMFAGQWSLYHADGGHWCSLICYRH